MSDILFEFVHVGVEEDEGEGDAEVEQEPDVYSLDVRCGGQLLTHLANTHYIILKNCNNYSVFTVINL